MAMDIKKIMCEVFKKYCANDIVRHFILGDILFANSIYDAPYELLDKYCDNKCGEDKYNTLLSYFVEDRNKREIELKLYFEKKKRYLDAISFFMGCHVLSDYIKELSSVSTNVYVERVSASNWTYGRIHLDKMRAIEFKASLRYSEVYEIYQFVNTPIGETQKNFFNALTGHNSAYRHISFKELQTSRYWKN